MHVNLKYMNVSMALWVWGSMHAHTSVVAYFLIFIYLLYFFVLIKVFQAIFFRLEHVGSGTFVLLLEYPELILVTYN